MFVLIAFGLCADSTAQVYTCRAPDGSRVFSDERCGADAKVVPGMRDTKRPAPKTKSPASTGKGSTGKGSTTGGSSGQGSMGKGSAQAGPQPGSKSESKAAPQPAAAASKPTVPKVVIVKSAAELDALLQQCDAGKVAACNDWTRSGGPNRLREKERQTQLACDSGSLTACEERYCSDGATEQCRAKVLDAAKMAGQTWYLRDADRKLSDGSTLYIVRCIREGEREMQDINVVCAPQASPLRCSDSGPDRAFAKLDAAASKYCERQEE